MKIILFKYIEQFIKKELKIKNEDLEYTLLKSKLFEDTILKKYKSNLYRTSNGIKFILSDFNYSNNGLDFNTVINNEIKKIYTDIKDILIKSENYKDAKKNINDYILSLDESVQEKLKKNYYEYESLCIFTDKKPNIPFLNNNENDIFYRFSTYSSGDTKDILSSNYEIFLRRTNLYYKKDNESTNIKEDYEIYSNFIHELLKKIPEDNILKILSTSNNIQEAEDILFEKAFPEVRKQIINKIDLLNILKTKEDLYKKHNIEELYNKIVNKFPELLSNIDYNIDEYKIKVNQFKHILEKEQIDFLKDETDKINFSNILSKKEFNKIFNLEKFEETVYIPEFVDERIYLEKLNNIEYDYKIVLNYNKSNNTAHPAFIFISNSLEQYEESINHLMTYLAKNKIELSNINNRFEPQLNHYFDDFESYVEVYNSENSNNIFIYWSESNSKLKDLLDELKINDYDLVKNIYLNFNNYNYENYDKNEILNFIKENKIENNKNKKLDI